MKAKLLITTYHALHAATNGIGLVNGSHTLADVLYPACQMFATLLGHYREGGNRG